MFAMLIINQSEKNIDIKLKIEISKEDNKEDYNSTDKESCMLLVYYKALLIKDTMHY